MVTTITITITVNIIILLSLSSYHCQVWRVLDKYPVIDGHNDFPMAIRDLFHNDMDSVNMDHDLTQVQSGYSGRH